MKPYDLEDQVVVSRSDRFTPDSTYVYQRDYRDPLWIGSRELLVFNYGLHVEQAAFFAPRPAGDPSVGIAEQLAEAGRALQAGRRCLRGVVPQLLGQGEADRPRSSRS
jgi:hypothetical protein